MKLREIVDFQVLKEEWNYFAKNNLMGDNVFLTWEWLSTWWKYFGKGRKLLVLLAEDKNKVLAIAPLMWSKYKLPGFGSVEKIEFVGAPHSDYHNFIVLGKGAKWLKLVVDFLKGLSDWNWIELKEVPELTPTASLLRGLLHDFSSRFKMKERVCNLCPYISLPTSFEFLKKGLDKKLRKNLRYYLRKIRERCIVKLERYDEAGFSVEEAMRIFITLHQKRWRMEGLAGAFVKDSFRDFHMDVANLFAEKGWLGLYFLTLDDKPVSVQYTFEYNQKMYYYLGGFDPEYSKYSVGNLMTMLLLDECIKKGFREYDLMRGNEPYKIRWTNHYKKNLEIRLIRKGLNSRFYDWVTSNITINKLASRLRLSLRPS